MTHSLDPSSRRPLSQSHTNTTRRSGLEKLEPRTMLSMVMGDGGAGCGCAACHAASKALSDVSSLQPNEIVVSQLARMQSSAAGDRIWQPLSQLPAARGGQVSHLPLRGYAPFTIDARQLKATLAQAPKEFTAAARSNPLVMSLPTPVGTRQSFSVVETQVLAPELAARLPDIKTYVARGIDDPSVTARLDVNPHTGFHAMVLSPSGTWAIDNYFHNDRSTFVSYFKGDINRVKDFNCLTVPTENDAPVFPNAGPEGGPENIPAGDVLRTFRVAITTTTSYNTFHGNTISSVLSAVTTTVNRMTGIYETDLSTRLQLVANTDLLFSGLNGNPVISGGTNVTTLANNNQSFTDGRIGFANYDVGHVFASGPNNGVSAGGIGIVGGGAKARACSQTSPPSGDLFSVDYVSHEMGHQFNGRHNFSNCSGGPGDLGSVANEPGSGATIMGYAGICSNNLQPNSDAMFNHINYNQMYPYILNTISSVGTTTATGNSAPIVEAGPNYTIPTRTPYVLTATGSDPDNDPLTWSWEQRDTGGSLPVNNTTGTTGPVVRTWLPASSPSRTIPRPLNLLSNTTATGEVLTQVARTMNFRVVARDGRGGVNFDDMVITTVNVGATGFVISNLNSLGQSFNGGSSIEVTWNIASTNIAPINTADVNIKLSVDGGNTFPITLANSSANDGSEFVQLPFNTGSTQSRLKLEAVGSIFFDVNNANFTVVNIPDVVAPGQPALAAASDSGVFDNDGITNFDNSTPAKALEFLVPGTQNGDTVVILADGVEIGSAIAAGTSTTVVTNGSTALSNGVRNITARRTPSGGSQSVDSALLPIMIDTIAPSLVGSPVFQYATAPHRLNYTFSEEVGPTIDTADIQVTQLPSTNVTTSVGYNAFFNVATFAFPGFTNGVLDDGNYSAQLTAAGITDIAGNALASNSNYNFFFLSGDANHDAIVNLLDFNTLAANFGLPGDFTQGDFDYNGTVALGDFNLLAARFGTAVGPDSLSRAPGTPPFGQTRIGSGSISLGDDDPVAELLV